MTLSDQIAEQLVEKFWFTSPQFNLGEGTKNLTIAKNNALICVEEIIRELQHIKQTYNLKELDKFEIKFWNQVKQHING